MGCAGLHLPWYSAALVLQAMTFVLLHDAFAVNDKEIKDTILNPPTEAYSAPFELLTQFVFGMMAQSV